MGVPKSKTSRMRARIRRAKSKVDAPNLNICPNCGATKLPHRACKNCGYYRGIKIITSYQERIEMRESKRREKEKESAKG